MPTLDKAEAALHQQQLWSPLARAGTGVVSSGTSRGQGPLLIVPRSSAELEASVAFARTWVDWTPPISQSVARGLALEVRTMHHGMGEGAPAPGRLRMPWTYTQIAFRQLAQLLGASHRGKRVTSLIIGLGALRPATAWLLENGLDPAAFAVRLIGTNGFRLSPFWRARLEQMWNAQVWDNFSLSEFATPAMQCRECGHHHWLTPPVLHEVLDVVSGEPIDRGIGELTMTGLQPFMQAMPLIRYRTGDLAEIGSRCRLARQQGFSPRGRISHSIFDGNRLLVSGQDVSDAIEGEAGVARHPHPVETLGLVKSRDAGPVKFRLQREGNRVGLDVETRFDPTLFAAEADALTQRIRSKLKCRELDVRAVRPGSLSSAWEKF